MTIGTAATVYASHPSTRFRIGELVSIDWNLTGRVTVHRIVAKQMNAPGCQTGVLFEVEPPVHRPDRSNKYADKWVDAAWFFKDGLETL